MTSEMTSGWPRRRALTGIGAALTVAFALNPVTAAPARAATNRLDLRVLVVDDGSPWVGGIADQLTLEGVPQTKIDLADPARPAITAATLASGSEGFYQAVVLPSSTGAGINGSLAPAELVALQSYESAFAVRQVDSYVYPSSTVGLNTPTFSGDLTGLTATATPAGLADGFAAFTGSLTFQPGSYGYLATPQAPADLPAGAAFTPLVTVPNPIDGSAGVLLGSYRAGGTEHLEVTAAFSSSLQQFRVLAHGLITWLTRGVHFGYNRNYLTFHLDDAFASDAQWDSAHNCTPGEDCPRDAAGESIYPETDVRMTPADVTYAADWQRTHDYRLTLAFNGFYADRAADPLTQAFVADKSAFAWLNHGSQHLYQGCVQNFTTAPWSCTVDQNGQVVWLGQSDIAAEIGDNITTGQSLGLSFDPKEYLSGEHSGLYLLPQQPVDNPNFAAAIAAAGITAIGADASREPGARTVGGATTVPRHPVAVYYNVATQADEIDEYNYFYTRAADGGSGYCETHADTATCLPAPLGANGYLDYIVPTDAANDLRFVLSNDPRPFYAHVSNLAGDRIVYPLLERILGTYRQAFSSSAPVVNLSLTGAAEALTRQTAWAAAGLSSSPSVTGYVQDGAVHISGAGSTAIPLTVPTGTTVNGAAFGAAYGGERSAWFTGDLTAALPQATITSAATAAFVAGKAGSFTVTTTGPTPRLSVTGALPSGLTFSDHGDGTAALAGTPAAGTGGVYPLTVTAAGALATTQRALTLTVGEAPAFTSATTAQGAASTAFSFTITTSGYPKATLTKTGTLPPGTTFTPRPDGTATISGTLASTARNAYPLTLTATNALGSATQTLTITAGQAPTISASFSATTTVGAAYTHTFTFGGAPLAKITLTGALPAGLTLTDLGTGSAVVSGTPAAGSGGLYTPSVIGTNPFGSTAQVFKLTVQERPTFTSAAGATLKVGVPATLTLTATGYPAPKITRTGALPKGLTFTNDTKGTATLTGTPAKAGSYPLTLTAANAAGSVTQTYTLVVN